jgi:uncharacterized protein YgfB (UPF0149 family)
MGALQSKYLLIHRHKFGVSHAFFVTEDFRVKDDKFSEELITKIAKLCQLDYDKDADEELTVLSVDENTTFVTKEDLK